MTKLEVLKSLLQDDIIRKNYGITQKDIDNVTLTSLSPNVMISFLQNFVMVIENSDYTINTAASNFNKFLEDKLR